METQKETSKMTIVSKYMDTVLETGVKPTSIYKFSKEIEIEEKDFYKFFSSFEQLEKSVFSIFFENAMSLLKKNEDFNEYNAKNKLLSFYFTFTEILTSNRSYVLLALKESKNSLKNLKQLQDLKRVFSDFISELEIDTLDFKQERIKKIQHKGIQEGFWIQLLMILKFWMEDNSTSFEKTDVFIEKSVHASFDIINTAPVKSFLDLGKFLLKEKMDFKL
ncbi:MAG: TetR family transcriptional regulator C-terminal domain-containing protein [Polaribacter sp.]|nr:TetR family transcriptional regulator C-terminal domain-containing protein [Polaribacter sp.]MDG1811564.1 TetR family transcriptional regulator C-terminal domain-containing protein [Polaribacter sp.]MDG1994788.1 TetR family transcriptional regulator C-terminal domain-containing protein [Polaribacter sp.]